MKDTDKHNIDKTLRIIGKKIEEVDKNNVGLYYGIACRTLYFIHLQKYFSNERSYDQIINEFIKRLFYALENNIAMDSSMGKGFTGIAWLFNYLNRFFPSLNPHFELTDINKYIIQSLRFDFDKGNYDALHGYIAKGNYLLTVLPDKESKKAIISIVEHLLYITEHYDGLVRWKASKRMGKFNIAYDLGIPHGMSGILIFLMKVYKKGILQVEIKDITERAVKWILRNEDSDGAFPGVLLEDDNDNDNHTRLGRLAWCYGNLCIALMLNKVGKTLKKVTIWEKSRDILIKSTSRKWYNSGVLYNEEYMDLCFCHGASGLALIYAKMYQEYKIKSLKTSSNTWLDYTIKYSKKIISNGNIDITLFNNLNKDHPDFNEVHLGLFNGWIGTGLILMYFFGNLNTTWDEIVYLS